jgi:hypothetical protein
MAEQRVWIAQLLCGPNRHCIAMMSGEAVDETEARRKCDVEAQVDELLRSGALNPWCGICHAERAGWRVEFGRTRFRTKEEAQQPLEESAAKQLVTSLLFGTHGADNLRRH